MDIPTKKTDRLIMVYFWCITLALLEGVCLKMLEFWRVPRGTCGRGVITLVGCAQAVHDASAAARGWWPSLHWACLVCGLPTVSNWIHLGSVSQALGIFAQIMCLKEMAAAQNVRSPIHTRDAQVIHTHDPYPFDEIEFIWDHLLNSFVPYVRIIAYRSIPVFGAIAETNFNPESYWFGLGIFVLPCFVTCHDQSWSLICTEEHPRIPDRAADDLLHCLRTSRTNIRPCKWRS